MWHGRREKCGWMDQPIVRLWKFRIENADGEGCYVGPDGRQDSVSEWTGTDSEVAAEAQRRVNAWEAGPEGGFVRVVCESCGPIGAVADVREVEA